MFNFSKKKILEEARKKTAQMIQDNNLQLEQQRKKREHEKSLEE